MEFKTPAQQKVFERVAELLKDLFGESAAQRPNAPVFWMRYGSCVVNIGVNPWGEEDATILVYSYVVTGADMRPDLLLYLLNKNDNVRFGGFTVDAQNSICFQHAIVGSTVDKTQLRTSVMAVVYTSDETDDEIVARWGGQRAMDR